MRIIFCLLLFSSYTLANQCEFDAIETIEYVADFGKAPVDEVNDIGRAFTREATDFPEYLMGGVNRAHKEYADVYQKVVDNKISLEQFEGFQKALTDQVGRDGYLRVMHPNEIKTIISQRGINPGTRGDVFFNNPSSGSGAHMGHGRNIVVVKCPTEKCAKYFSQNYTPTGSGLVADDAIPLEDLEFIIPDVDAAARSVGISFD